MRKFFLSLFFPALIVGCATPLVEVKQQAKDCVAGHHDETGVLTPASDEYRKECWVEFNKRLEAQARAEERRKKQEGNCSSGTTLVCDDRWDNCGCVFDSEIRRVLRGLH